VRARCCDAWPLRGPVLAGTDATDALEGGAQRVRRAIADGAGDGGDGFLRVEEEVRGERQPPLGEELHR